MLLPTVSALRAALLWQEPPLTCLCWYGINKPLKPPRPFSGALVAALDLIGGAFLVLGGATPVLKRLARRSTKRKWRR